MEESLEELPFLRGGRRNAAMAPTKHREDHPGSTRNSGRRRTRDDYRQLQLYGVTVTMPTLLASIFAHMFRLAA